MKKLWFIALCTLLLNGCIDEITYNTKAQTKATLVPVNATQTKPIPTQVKPAPTPTATPSATPKPTPTPLPELPLIDDEQIETEDLGENTDITQQTGSVKDPYSDDTYAENGPREVAMDLSKKKVGWYFNRNKTHEPPTAQNQIDLSKYDAVYLGDTENKTVYLTFDQGYENGFTTPILDTLKEKNVKAVFFLTKPYIKSNPDLVMRMIDEGHLCANHSVTHKSAPTLTDKEFYYELEETARYFEEVTGKKMPRYYRPPAGEYSERVLALAHSIGYKTIFWSFAYQDWLVDKQPGKAVAYKTVMDNLHNGSVMLLHSVSSSNAQALPEIIDSVIEKGYSFKRIDELI